MRLMETIRRKLCHALLWRRLDHRAAFLLGHRVQHGRVEWRRHTESGKRCEKHLFFSARESTGDVTKNAGVILAWSSISAFGAGASEMRSFSGGFSDVVQTG